MKNTIYQDIRKELNYFFRYIKTPFETFDEQLNFYDKQRIFTILLIAQLIFTTVVVIPISYLVDSILPLHPKEIFFSLNVYFMILAAVIAAPIVEELIFRLPLKWNRNFLLWILNEFVPGNKIHNFWNRNYKFFFYAFAIAFGYMHLSNFENDWTFFFLVLSPLIVMSQLVAGFVFGYIRNRLGLIWSMLFHAFFNFFLLITPYLIYDNTQLVEIKNEKMSFNVTYLQFEEMGNSYYTISEKDGIINNIEARNMSLSHFTKVVFGKKYSSKEVNTMNLDFQSKDGVTKKELLEIMKSELKMEVDSLP